MGSNQSHLNHYNGYYNNPYYANQISSHEGYEHNSQPVYQ